MIAMTRRNILASAGTAIVAVAASRAGAAAPRPKPLVFGHRGCSALRPEHTLGSYAKAIQDGADFIEPDLVATKDGVLIARHENNIAETTDIVTRPEFAGRKTSKTIDGQSMTGWFTEDFTLDELKTLRAIERLGAVRPESSGYNSQFQILTFDEIVDFAAAESAARGRVIGLIPELKHSTYFAGIGLPLEDRFLDRLAAHDYTRGAPVQIQSFEVANLRYLRRKLGRPANIKLVQLVGEGAVVPADIVEARGRLTFEQMVTPAGLKDMATYADVVGPATRGVIPLGPDGRLAAPRPIVADAHGVGLQVCIWTFRPENRFLAADFRNGGENERNPAGSLAEIKRYLATGVDSIFTDDPAIGRRAVDEMFG